MIDEDDEIVEQVINNLTEQHRIAAERDDNREILKLIVKRMGIGVERYGHGLRAFDDTRQWGTDVDSWVEMALEEVLDQTVYLAMEIIRIQRHMNSLLELRSKTASKSKQSNTGEKNGTNAGESK